MPSMHITHQRGALSAKQKAVLAEELTHAMLIAETGADTPEGRSVAYIVFDEKDPATEWFTGGKPDTDSPTGGRFLFNVVFPVGASDQAAKTELHKAINDSIARLYDVDGSFPNRGGDWVLIHEITDGNWGVSGLTVGIQEIAQVVKAAPERTPFFEGLLVAQERLRDAHGFPAGAARS